MSVNEIYGDWCNTDISSHDAIMRLSILGSLEAWRMIEIISKTRVQEMKALGEYSEETSA